MTKIFRLLFLLPALVLMPLTALADEGWIDVTSQYIVNPNFDGDSNAGWQGTSPGHAQAGSNAGEHWNCTFDTWQKIDGLPNGHYRLTVQAFYRPGNPNQRDCDAYCNGRGYVNAFFYADNVEMPVVDFYSEYSLEQLPNTVAWLYNSLAGTDVCYPHSMYAGVACFDQGLYVNTLEVDVTDGSLVIGICSYSDGFRSEQWCLFDNWKLEQWGEVVNVTAITLNPNQLKLNMGETRKVTATISPSDATWKSVKWSTSNSRVAVVDASGNVTGMSRGKATITATATDESGVTAACPVTVTNNGATAESLIINEIMVGNLDTYLDPSLNYGAYVELYNPTDEVAGIGRYYVSDDANDLCRWQLPVTVGSIPAHGYLVLWFDHYSWRYGPKQVAFDLEPEGGTLYISDDGGTLIASQEYPAAVSRASWARVKDGDTAWRFTSTPTPGSSNASSAFADEQLAAPVVREDTQTFTSTFAVHVEIPDGTTLRYTTDGSVPTLTNGNTSQTGVITIRKTTPLRFRLFADGMLPSPVVTRTFIQQPDDRDYSLLPVLSVVTEKGNLYSTDYGLFTKGPNGRAGNGQDDKCNWNMDWDRPVNFELLLEDGTMAVNQEVNLSACGGWSRAWGHHSFKLKANRRYEGKNFIDYPLFSDKPFNKNKTVQIRNGGNDSDCRIKDPALQEIIARSGLDIDCQAYVPVMHFINGTYIGLINMREPNNKHFSYANYGLDSEEQDQFEISPDSGYIQMAGTRDAFEHWYELAEQAEDDAVYDQILKLVDVDEFINYIAIEFYLGNWDWPKNNLKAFRPRTEDGRFRFVVFDLDGAFSVGDPFTTFESKRIFTFDPLRGEYSGQITAEIEVVTIFLNMLKNARFRKQFTDAYCLVAGSVFEPSRCRDIIEELAARIEEPLSYEWRSPWGTANSLISSLSSGYQKTNINYLKNYNRMQLSGVSTVNATLASDVEGATLDINGLPVPTGAFSGQLFAPAVVTAHAPAGYTFLGWRSLYGTDEKTLLPRGSSWHYYDKGSLDGKAWKSNGYNDSTWGTGEAPLGYFVTDKANSRGYKTFVDYGGDTNDKYPTTYFRTTLTLNSTPSATDEFILDYTCDDGFVIYVNGNEAGRYLMPNGTPKFSTYASSHAQDNPDSGTLKLKTSLFKLGTNTIAVELHNNAANSTDIYWDCAINAHITVSGDAAIISKETSYTLPSSGSVSLVAAYQRADGSDPDVVRPIRINEVSPANSIYVNDLWKKSDWIELYNATGHAVDLTGMYLSDDPADLHKYVIPAVEGVDNLIPAHGHKVVWCDKLDPVTQVHAQFKLASEGGYVLLTAADDSDTDIFEYPACAWNQTVGLYPDGGAATCIMQRPTIGAPNTITTADIPHTQDHSVLADIRSVDDDTTSPDDDAPIYDLMGRRYDTPAALPAGTIYIQGGRKYIRR